MVALTRPSSLINCRMSLLVKKQQPKEPGRYQFSIEEYHHLVDTGFFTREDRVELIEGELIMMPPPSPDHSAHTTSLRMKIERKLPDDVILRIADSITLPPLSEPEPDLCIVRRRADFYKKAHPTAKDVLQVIEISKSSLDFDTGQKAVIYGRAGIREYWVLDLPSRCLHVFTAPGKQGYRTQKKYLRGETVNCGTISQIKLPVADMLL
jgi:Uma2 family endonuclease